MKTKIRPEKQTKVKEISEKFSNSSAVIFLDNLGIDAADMTELRDKIYETQSELKIYKNTLAKIALKEQKVEGVDEFLTGPTMTAFAKDEGVSLAKAVFDFSKKEGSGLKIKAAYFEGKIQSSEVVSQYASLPGREELLARLLGSLSAPIQNLLVCLDGNKHKIVRVLGAIEEQKKSKGE